MPGLLRAEDPDPEAVADLPLQLGVAVGQPRPPGGSDQLGRDHLARDRVVELDGVDRCPDQAPVPTAGGGLLDLAAHPGEPALGRARAVAREVAHGRQHRLRHDQRHGRQDHGVVDVLLEPGASADRIGDVDQDRSGDVDRLDRAEGTDVDRAPGEDALELAPAARPVEPERELDPHAWLEAGAAAQRPPEAAALPLGRQQRRQ
jgi:hypothetical protein